MKTLFYTSALAALVLLCGCAITGASDLGLTIEGEPSLDSAIARARTVAVAAWTLSPQQRVTRELADDARHGATVVVVLSRNAFGTDTIANNLSSARLLRAAGAHVGYSRIDSHLKVAVVDGTPWWADTNFSAGGTVVRDDLPQDRDLALAAIAGRPGSNDHLWTTKGEALAVEARVAGTRASRALYVESESFGPGTALNDVLVRRSRLHDDVRLLVAAREALGAPQSEAEAIEQRDERDAIAGLERAGVRVRYGFADEKLAVDGPDLYLGSANSTAGEPGQVEWAIAARSTTLAAALKGRFLAEWAQARP